MKASLKKLNLVFSLSLLFVFALSLSTSNAQMGKHLLDENPGTLFTEVPSENLKNFGIDEDVAKRAQLFFVELGGPSILVTFNYDTRFSKSNKGAGIRAGFGGFVVEGDGFLTVPIQVNYLLGDDKHFFEIGGGATIFTGNVDLFDDSVSNTTVIGTMTFGYRLQPADSGFSFRAGINPIFGDFDNGFTFIPWFPSIAFGYKW
ncbi:MAG: hypothetical protein AAF502_09940 [Bacteroidota bacterium]